jgi:dolichol-phosphate mannosyltransferase
MSTPALISVVVPVYNEEPVLPLLFARLTTAADAWSMAWEVVCVDDGSSDGSWQLLLEQSRADPRWRSFRFSRNFGHQAALSAGLKHCRGDAAIIIDADLQDPPEELARFIGEWRAGHEVVYGVRESRSDGVIKRFLAWTFYRIMQSMVAFNIPPDAGEFALLDRRVIDVLVALPERSRYLRGLRAWCGFRQKAVPFRRVARAAGTPHYSFAKSLNLALDGVLAFSPVPLRVATYLGLAVTGIALFFALFALLQPLLRDAVPNFDGNPDPDSTLIVVTLLAGVQLFCIGILGEYVGRIHMEVQRRPLWIIRESSEPIPECAAPLARRVEEESG